MSVESENRQDHGRLFEMVANVLNEIREMRIDMRELISSQSEQMETLKNDMFEEKRRLDEAVRTANGLKKLLWIVIGTVATVSGLAVGKSMGIL